MPVITLALEYLDRLSGIERSVLFSRLPMIGSSIEKIEKNEAQVEFFPDRPDLFSAEGVARAMRGFLNLEAGLPLYKTSDSGITCSVDPLLHDIRPVFRAAVIRDLDFSDDAILSMMGLQEALHWAVGRGRSKVAIGLHDLDKVTPPFRYFASDKDWRFIPLDYSEMLTLDGILKEHPKGKAYAKVIEKFSKYPLIIDSNDEVLSFPPIINGELTRVTSDTKNAFLDVTGTDLRAVNVALNIICTALAETGAKIETVSIEGTSSPNLSPVLRKISIKEANELTGLSLTLDETATLLKRMRYGVEPCGEDKLDVYIPCFRADIMHDWDVFEDIAIAFGYENFTADIPDTFTIGLPHPVHARENLVRDIMSGLTYIQVMPFTLTSEEIMYTKTGRSVPSDLLRVKHPISIDQSVVRTDILPLLLETLVANRHRELPHRLFASGDVVHDTRTTQNLGAVSCHNQADFSEAYATIDALCRELALTYTVCESNDPLFMEGRRADILINKKKAGVFGEIHPRVLTAFELEHPVSAFELDLMVLPGFRVT